MRKAMEVDERIEESDAGDHTESLRKLDENKLEDEKLVNTVEGRLENLNKLTQDMDEVDDELDTPIPDVPEDNAEEDDGQAAVEGGAKDTNLEVDKDENGQDVTVNIPDAFVRAAVHNGWSQDDVDNLIEANPELALKTLSNNYNSVANANKEWSALGRAKVTQERVEAEAAAAIPQAQPDFTVAEIQKLRTDYGDDPAVAKLIANAEKQAAQPRTVQQPADMYRTATAHANASANAATDQLIGSFFNAADMKPYKEFYGELGMSQSVNDLTNGQQEHRLAVLEHAEYIMTGLRMRGIDPTVPQVLEKAHLIVTEPIREQVIRNTLKASAVQRRKGMTFRPSKSKKTGGAVNTNNQQKPRDRNELLSKVAQRLANVPGLHR